MYIMKKLFLVVFIFIVSTTIAKGNTDDRFVQAFSTCSAYSENGSLKADGMDVTSTKKIIGWQNGKCVYQEKINFMETQGNVVCRFTQQQVNEITEVMNAYNVIQKYSKEKLDTSNLSSDEKNAVTEVWNKYLMDNSVCNVNLL